MRSGSVYQWRSIRYIGSKMTIVIPFGLAKVQRMPFALWEGIKDVGSEAELIQFVQANEQLLRPLVRDRLSGGKAESLFTSGRIEKRQEAYYLAEALKSAALRGGGSSIMGWSLWHANGCSETMFRKLPPEQVRLKIAGVDVTVPVSHVIELDSVTESNISLATLLLHDALAGGKGKTVTRADYVLERGSDGGIVPCLVDVGESNLSFALTDALFKSFLPSVAGCQPLMAAYLDNVIKAFGGIPRLTAIVAEDQKMLAGMPYEFAALSNGLEQRMAGAGIEPNVVITDLSSLITMPVICDSVVRCFRSRTAAGLYLNAFKNMPETIDDPDFIYAYDKKNLRQVVRQKTHSLAQLVKVPESEVFQLCGNSEDESSLDSTVTHIFKAFSERGIDAIVIKPAEKPLGTSSTALFYNIRNPYHLQQAVHSVAKLYRKGVRDVIVEEAVGTGLADGRKTEIRVFAFGYN